MPFECKCRCAVQQSSLLPGRQCSRTAAMHTDMAKPTANWLMFRCCCYCCLAETRTAIRLLTLAVLLQSLFLLQADAITHATMHSHLRCCCCCHQCAAASASFCCRWLQIPRWFYVDFDYDNLHLDHDLRACQLVMLPVSGIYVDHDATTAA